MMWRSAMLVTAAVVLPAHAGGQGGSSGRAPTVHHHSLAFDSDGIGVSFGGSDDGPLAPATTWRVSGAEWRSTGTTGPCARASYGLVYHDAGKHTVLFGGWTPSGLLDDTWLWDGQVWREMSGGVHPSPRMSPAIAYDPLRQRVVLFGGSGDAAGETWEWNGTSWHQAHPAQAPSPRGRATMAFDDKRRAVLLFGGFDRGNVLGDTWLWDGTNWLLQAVNGPPGRANHVMAAHPQRGIVLFGGWQSRPDSILGDTWLWDGRAWRQHDLAGPPAREMPAFAWDPQRRELVLHGGRNPAGTALGDVWFWNGQWRKAQADVPHLSLEGGLAAASPGSSGSETPLIVF